MDWVLQHLQLIIGAAGAVAWWLNQHRQQQKAAGPKPLNEATIDSGLAERTRRIREEIQRKIEQRTGTHSPMPKPLVRNEPVATPPVIPKAVQRPEPRSPVLGRTATAQLEAQKTAEILEHQAALAEQLRNAAQLKAAALRRLQFENQLSSGDEAAVAARGAIGEDLKNPEALRRAFILREIIGPPVALRS